MPGESKTRILEFSNTSETFFVVYPFPVLTLTFKNFFMREDFPTDIGPIINLLE
jgi:hypothetical protein